MWKVYVLHFGSHLYSQWTLLDITVLSGMFWLVIYYFLVLCIYQSWLLVNVIITVEWICWLNGQRKNAPTPEVWSSTYFHFFMALWCSIPHYENMFEVFLSPSDLEFSRIFLDTFMNSTCQVFDSRRFVFLFLVTMIKTSEMFHTHVSSTTCKLIFFLCLQASTIKSYVL